MTALCCFFGAELKADGKPFTPALPSGSSLVITQCAVTAAVPEASAATGTEDSSAAAAVPATFSAVTLYCQSSTVPARIALCTLSPGQQVYYCPMQLIFAAGVTFTLVPQHKPLREGAPVAYPTVHLTGYFEKEEDPDDMSDDEDEEGDGAAFLGNDANGEEHGDDSLGDSEDEDAMYMRSGRGRQQQQQQRPPSRQGGKRSRGH